MLKKPTTCAGCPLHTKGLGFGPAFGSKDAPILAVGEALGTEEARQGKGFVGPSGMLLNKVFRHVGINRDQVRIHNIVSCQPPKNWLVGAPWESRAVEQCSQYINTTLFEGNHKVVLALGSTAAKELLGLSGKKGVSIFDLHGAPSRDRTDKYWVVPTFHPSFLLQGAWKLYGTMVFDVSRALDIAKNGHEKDPAKLIMDPGWAKFDEWVRKVLHIAEQTQGGLWLAVDIETPHKFKGTDEDETLGDNILDTITRINFSYDENEGITVPFDAQHMDGISMLLRSPHIKKSFWNMNFDVPNLEAAGCIVAEPMFDMMYAFHALQSDVKMSLGFVAPFYSTYGPWKHLTDHKVRIDLMAGEAANNYKRYSAIDGVQTIRVTKGLEEDLNAVGLWNTFERHIRDIDRFCYRPAEKIGLLFDREKLEKFRDMLAAKETEKVARCQALAPDDIVPYEKTWKTSKAATDVHGFLLPGCLKITETSMCYVCPNCGSINVSKTTHPKTKKCRDAQLKFEEHEITYWAKKGNFNPNSSKQVLSYIRSQGHEPGKQKKSLNDTSDVQTLEKLAKKHKNNTMYPMLLELRKINKMKGTYCDGILSRLDEHNRVHSTFTHIPSTLRASSKNPNLQNLVSKDKKEDENEYGKRFRECVIASPGCTFIEADYGGIEAVETGWFAKDPAYIRLAKLSVHAYLTSHLVGNPADLTLSDAELKGIFDEIKNEYKIEYNKAKRVVHGSAYGLSTRGLHLTYPEVFPTMKSAKEVQDVFFTVASKVHEWQNEVIKKADQQGYLGGSDHPFHYRHWFWNVIQYKKISPAEANRRLGLGLQTIKGKDGTWYSLSYGTDAKRCIAFYPQSTAGGVLKEHMLVLFDPDSPEYIGDIYYGDTPLRAPIHDAMLLEVPDNKVDFVVERMAEVMRRPITQQSLDPSWNMGEYLSMDIAIEAGKDWAKMEHINI